METLKLVNYVISILFFCCYFYQLLYIPIPWFLGRRHKSAPTDMRHSYAVLICARNEEQVIAALIESLHRQTYPADKLHIFVLADNCTDDTAAVARSAGAEVYVRHNRNHIGKC